jgi:tetratricopeptide (TPR) repeat protein
VQRRQGELDSAQELLFTALDIRRELKDSNQQTGETLLEIGHIYRLKNDMESAESIYEKGLEVIDEMDEVAGDTIFALAQIQVTKSEYQEAFARFERVRDFRVSKYGRDSMKTGCTSRSLGQVQFLRNDQDQAMVHLNEFVRVYELQDEDASETVDYAMAVFLLGEIHNKRNNAEQAENLWTIAKEVCDDNDFDKQVPEFVAMVNRRLEGAGDPNEKKGGGFLSKLAGISNTGLLPDPEERKVVENLIFVDDY